MGLQGVTKDYKELQGFTMGYKGDILVIPPNKGLQGVRVGYNGVQGVTNRLQEVTRGYRGQQGVTKRTGG